MKSSGNWYLDLDNIVTLENGLWPQLGPDAWQDFEQGKTTVSQSFGSKRRILDGSRILLLAQQGLLSEAITLEHMSTGDLDSPEVIILTKEE